MRWDHHGERAAPGVLDHLMGDRRATEKADWEYGRRELIELILAVLKPSVTLTKEKLSGPDFMLLSGLTSFADWIGSNEEWFKFGNPADCADLNVWFQARRACAEQALDAIGWEFRTPLAKEVFPARVGMNRGCLECHMCLHAHLNFNLCSK